MTYQIERLIKEGKKRRVYTVRGEPHLLVIEFSDQSHGTASDGPGVFQGKGILSHTIACNVFRLLQKNSLPLAFMKQENNRSFVARFCKAFPFTVVVRRQARGLYLKQHPKTEEGDVLQIPSVEYYLKSKNREWGRYELPCDTPLLVPHVTLDMVELFDPTMPQSEQHKTFSVLPSDDLLVRPNNTITFKDVEDTARAVFHLLEMAWLSSGFTLADLTMRFGCDESGALVLSHAIDNHSWTLIKDDELISEPVDYSNETSPAPSMNRHYTVAAATHRFNTLGKRMPHIVIAHPPDGIQLRE